jgi:lipoprotein-anchoring transpeptidase ErfK/SrfK
VTLVDATGAPVTGALRADGSSWLPDKQLSYGTQYTATIKATKTDGTSAEAKTTFTTMAEPARTARVRSHWIEDGQTVGVGMPIVIEFDTVVPANQRAAIERRLFVESNPPQVGSWHWMSSATYHTLGSEVHFRPKEYWQPGTQIHARAALGGMPWGYEGVYGRNDLTLDFTVGDANIIEVDDATKMMTFTRNGEVIREIPVSLGRPNPPEMRSSSGHMLIFTREHPRVFDTSDRASGGYVTEVQYAEQITFSGEFIHDAPWSVEQQGNTNVSHGCLNVSPENGEWIYNEVHLRGDPVIVRNTGKQLEWGDGFTQWDMPWEEWVKGSALYGLATPAATPSA